jgi:hypothetical protein
MEGPAGSLRAVFVFVFAVVFGFGFGALDQYLGSVWSLTTLGAWAVSISGMSAPWLALPFAFGATQRSARRGAAIGVVVTASALLGYFAMTLSPIEGVHAGSVDLPAFAASQRFNIVGGALTGPLFGLLGYAWRVKRWWLCAVAVAVAFGLEPAARAVVGRLDSHPGVWFAEVAVGAALCVYAVRTRARTNE